MTQKNVHARGQRRPRTRTTAQRREIGASPLKAAHPLSLSPFLSCVYSMAMRRVRERDRENRAHTGCYHFTIGESRGELNFCARARGTRGHSLATAFRVLARYFPFLALSLSLSCECGVRTAHTCPRARTRAKTRPAVAATAVARAQIETRYRIAHNSMARSLARCYYYYTVAVLLLLLLLLLCIYAGDVIRVVGVY